MGRWEYGALVAGVDIELMHEYGLTIPSQETLNYWKQLPHILKYFRAEEDPTARRPTNFMSGFLEVSLSSTSFSSSSLPALSIFSHLPSTTNEQI